MRRHVQWANKEKTVKAANEQQQLKMVADVGSAAGIN
uniref:Uncharacterized protein n=1 Tax=Rhizophora mucronata TaxID=61149 RepID=A0A2P2K2F8_RHIMU